MSVVTRFAPSPTGYVHVGSQRTALYNYIFARQQKGKFILRVEDTDQNRYVEGAVENLLSSLEQLGIEFDAGPGKEDDKGPYFQSERNEIYKKEVQKYINTKIIKNNAVPKYARKLLSGLGKKNKIAIPIKIIIGIKLLVFILKYGPSRNRTSASSV